MDDAERSHDKRVSNNAPHPQNRYVSRKCETPSCWSEQGVKVVQQKSESKVALCRYCRKHIFGVTS
jgi:hypothetical protein